MTGVKRTLIIFGPTVTGKTSLAIKLAKKLNEEIVSADSRQVYKNLDIGTGKVSFDSKTEKYNGYWQVDGVKTYGFDIAMPGQAFSVANFIDFASRTIKTIEKQNKIPIIVGGTGFYIKSLLYGIDSIGIAANKRLRKLLEKEKVEDLYKRLEALNQIRAQSMNASDRANPRRLIRAIEIASYKSTFKNSNINYQPFILTKEGPTIYPDKGRTNISIIGLSAPNNYLFKKADNWLDLRIKKGLIEEVDSLLAQNIPAVWLDSLGLEYRWISRYLLNKIDKNIAIERLKGDIHSLIRRQKTYFSQFKDIQIYDITQKNWNQQLEINIENWLKNKQKN